MRSALPLAAIYGYVMEHPGCRIAQIANALGVPRSTVAQRLPKLDAAGLLLWEDDNRRIYPFAVAERKQLRDRILGVLNRHAGLKEQEIAGLVGVSRRTVNDRLRTLRAAGSAYKHGVLWFRV